MICSLLCLLDATNTASAAQQLCKMFGCSGAALFGRERYLFALLLAALFALRLEIGVGAGAKICRRARRDTPAQILWKIPRVPIRRFA